MNNLNDTRMRRSGCRKPTYEIIDGFLDTLYFPEITRQKRSSSCSRKKVVLRKSYVCGVVVQSVLKVLTPPVSKILNKISKRYSGCGLFLHLFLEGQILSDFQFSL